MSETVEAYKQGLLEGRFGLREWQEFFDRYVEDRAERLEKLLEENQRLRSCLEEIEECAESYGSSWCNWYASQALQEGEG
jgi:hypothetical protein